MLGSLFRDLAETTKTNRIEEQKTRSSLLAKSNMLVIDATVHIGTRLNFLTTIVLHVSILLKKASFLPGKFKYVILNVFIKSLILFKNWTFVLVWNEGTLKNLKAMNNLMKPFLSCGV